MISTDNYLRDFVQDTLPISGLERSKGILHTNVDQDSSRESLHSRFYICQGSQAWNVQVHSPTDSTQNQRYANCIVDL